LPVVSLSHIEKPRSGPTQVVEHLPNLKVQVQILPGSPTFSKA